MKNFLPQTWEKPYSQRCFIAVKHSVRLNLFKLSVIWEIAIFASLPDENDADLMHFLSSFIKPTTKKLEYSKESLH